MSTSVRNMTQADAGRASGADLQDASELGVSIGDMLATLALSQGSNDIAQGKKPLVDLDALREALTCSACVLLPLTACSCG